MKKHVTYRQAKPFLDWLLLQPKKVQILAEFELSFTDFTNKNPTLVTFYIKDDAIDGYDLFAAFTRITQTED